MIKLFEMIQYNTVGLDMPDACFYQIDPELMVTAALPPSRPATTAVFGIANIDEEAPPDLATDL